MSDDTDIAEIFDKLPFDEISEALGITPGDAKQGAALALPALLSGMEANAQDPSAAASLFGALQTKDPSILDGTISFGGVDTVDGEKIVEHIFGDTTQDVASRLGGSGGLGGDMMKQVLAFLAPIVMAYIAKKIGGAGAETPTTTTGSDGTPGMEDLTKVLGGVLGGGGIEGVLGQVLRGMATPTSGSTSSSSSGTHNGLESLTELLGGLLGGGTR